MEISGSGLVQEYARARKLCAWVHEKGLGGRGWEVEGFVKMNAGFEMIWCYFESESLRLVEHLNVTAPLLSEPLLNNMYEEEEADMTSYLPLPSTTTRSPHATHANQESHRRPPCPASKFHARC